MQRTLGTSGAETLSAAANVFVGQTEAPLVIRPYVSKMTRSELMAVMVGGTPDHSVSHFRTGSATDCQGNATGNGTFSYDGKS